ncbi:MAG: phosphate ABC transporter substrate-binding protein PstS [Candidatus Sulfotelmatobacter sp.]|jgi:phosphate transport system substrate-binding protein
MCSQRQTLAVCIATAALSSLLLALGCSSKSDSESDQVFTPSPNAPTAALGAAGSTFIAPLMGKWVSRYHQSHPKIQINYRPIGSGGGIEEMKKGYLSFGASDAPLSDDQAKEMSPVIQVPATAGPVCIIYNLPNLSVPLRLSAKSLSDMYLGSIISWQDPSIVKDNPGVKLPKAPVIVVHRSDGSGTTNIFTSYLAKVSHDWSWKSGHGLSVTWPTGLGAEGSKGVLAIVKQTPGTIGYLELNYAKENGVPVASIQNQAGHFVQPSPGSTAAAISAFSDALAKDVRTPIVDPPASAADAYPISGLTFILIRKDRSDPGEQEAIKDFIAFAISTGQDSAEELSYAKLPDSVQRQGQELLSQLTANGQPLK